MDSILRLPAVSARTSLSRSTIYDRMARGDFPKPIKLTPKSIGWRASDIDQWIESRKLAA